MELLMRVGEKIKQPMEYADVQNRITTFEYGLKRVDKEVRVTLGRVSIVQNGVVKEYLQGGIPWKDVTCQGYSDEKMQWFADATITSSDHNLIERLKLYPFDDTSIHALVLEPLKFGVTND